MWCMLSIYVVYVQYTWCMLIVLGICLYVYTFNIRAWCMLSALVEYMLCMFSIIVYVKYTWCMVCICGV